jgi:hypothetical protein
MNAAKTQSRVRKGLEIVSRVSDWAGGKDQAMAWYRGQRRRVGDCGLWSWRWF